MKAAQTKAETKASPWKTYRTRFLVKAKQLRCGLVFTDSLGRQHSGRKGDYLVESSDGVLSIAPRQIFEDIYVPVMAGETPGQDETPALPRIPPQYETPGQNETFRQPGRARGKLALPLPAHLARKSPQP